MKLPVHLRGTGRLLTPSQLLDSNTKESDNSSAFGSATFSFNCSLSHPRITDHVSVLFTEEAQNEGESSAPNPQLEDVHNLSYQQPTSKKHQGQPQPASVISLMPEAYAQPDL